MHTCPFCGEECDCDLDDTGGLPVPDDCPHVCAEPDWDEEDEEDPAVDDEEAEFEYLGRIIDAHAQGLDEEEGEA